MVSNIWLPYVLYIHIHTYTYIDIHIYIYILYKYINNIYKRCYIYNICKTSEHYLNEGYWF